MTDVPRLEPAFEGGVVTDERTLDRLIAHLRAHVAELRRMERDGATAEDVADRKRLILRLQDQLAYAVRDLLSVRATAAPPAPAA